MLPQNRWNEVKKCLSDLVKAIELTHKIPSWNHSYYSRVLKKTGEGFFPIILGLIKTPCLLIFGLNLEPHSLLPHFANGYVHPVPSHDIR